MSPRTALRRVVVLLLSVLSLLALAGPAHAAFGTTNDYPYASQSDFSAVDRWGFTQRQCVSFAAWRLEQQGRPLVNSTATPWGSAHHWDEHARQLGKAVSATPRVGAIAQWNAGEQSPLTGLNGSAVAPGSVWKAGSYGHVAVVQAVYSDGSVKVSQYNGDGQRTYSTMDGRAPRYLYL